MKAGAVGRGRIALAVDRRPQRVAALADQHGVEEIALPVLLAAEGERDQAGGLELVEHGENVVPVGRLGRAGLARAPAFDIQSQFWPWMLTGTANILPLRVAALTIASGITLFHFCSVGELIDVAQQVVLDELVELLAGVELHGRRAACRRRCG